MQDFIFYIWDMIPLLFGYGFVIWLLIFSIVTGSGILAEKHISKPVIWLAVIIVALGFLTSFQGRPAVVDVPTETFYPEVDEPVDYNGRQGEF